MQKAPDSKSNDSFFYPNKAVVKQARIKEYDKRYAESIRYREGFWSREAESLFWYKKWEKVLDDSEKPFYKWFTGGKTNIVANAIDRHLDSETKNKLTLIWEGEPGDVRTYSYFALNREVLVWKHWLKELPMHTAVF